MEFSTKNANTIVVNVNFYGGYEQKPINEVFNSLKRDDPILVPKDTKAAYIREYDIERFYIAVDQLIQDNLELFPIFWRTMPNPLKDLPAFYELVREFGLLHIGRQLYKADDVNSPVAYLKNIRESASLSLTSEQDYGLEYDSFNEWAELLNFMYLGIQKTQAPAMENRNLWDSILSDLHLDFETKTIQTKTLKSCAMLYCTNKDFPYIKFCSTCSNKFVDNSRRGNKIHCSEKCRMNSYLQKRLKDKIIELNDLVSNKYSFDKMNTTNLQRRSVRAECLECGHTFEHSEEFFRHQQPGCPKCKR